MAKEMFCLNCNTVSKPKIQTKGSIIIELILWCCFIVPGLIYSMWRQTTKYKSCRLCGTKSLIPLNSPKAERLKNGLWRDESPSHIADAEAVLSVVAQDGMNKRKI